MCRIMFMREPGMMNTRSGDMRAVAFPSMKNFKECE
jgi:hypothetical protein